MSSAWAVTGPADGSRRNPSVVWTRLRRAHKSYLGRATFGTRAVADPRGLDPPVVTHMSLIQGLQHLGFT